MKFKKKNFLKIIIITGLSIIGAGIFAVSSMGEGEIVSSGIETETTVEPKYLRNKNSSLRDSLEIFGKELLGVPYLYAGTSEEGFDCSGFVYYVFRNFSIDVPRSTSLYGEVGNEIPIEHVQKGDLLLFLSPTRDEIGHIGIVTNPNGMETEFIHASSGKEMEVIVSSLKQPNYNRRFVRAISILNE